MPNYHRMLVAIDLTDEAPQVLAKAAELAKSHGASASVVTVIRPINYAYAGLDAGFIAKEMVGFQEQAEASAREKLAVLAADAGLDPAAIDVVFGVPSDTIREQAATANADLIVVGTHGRHGLGRLLGSTANGVLHGTPCDVLAVRVSTD
ncbi:MAG: universal stress protein [Pseudomonadales bacterium]